MFGDPSQAPILLNGCFLGKQFAKKPFASGLRANLIAASSRPTPLTPTQHQAGQFLISTARPGGNWASGWRRFRGAYGKKSRRHSGRRVMPDAGHNTPPHNPVAGLQIVVLVFLVDFVLFLVFVEILV